MSQNALPTEIQQAPHPAKLWAGRLVAIAFGVLFAWLLAEALLRLFFFSLPPRLQLVLTHVRQTPFSDARLLPDPLWQPDSDYLTITRPAQNHAQFGSAEVRFTVSTETLWGSRPAFRTRQDMVDRYVDGVAIGDSFTFCFADDDACWVQRLSAQTGRNIINLGITSTGSLSHQLVLENFGMPLEPPLVIWEWFGNDANEDYGLARMRNDEGLPDVAPPPPVPERNWLEDNSAFYVLLQLLLGSDERFKASLQFHDPEYVEAGDVRLAFGQPYLWDAFDAAQPQNRYGWQRSQEAILESRDMVESYGGTLLILLMPTKEQVYRHLSEPLLGAEKLALLDEPYQLMRAFCEEQNLTCLDLLPVFEAHTDEQIYYTTDMHLNPLGNEVLAETLAAWIAEHPQMFDTP